MKIEGLKINGLKNPVGYAFDSIRLSYHIADYMKGKKGSVNVKTQSVRVEISTDPQFMNIVYDREIKNSYSGCIIVDMETVPRTRYHVRVKVTMDDGSTAVNNSKCYFETGKKNEPWSAQWIGIQEEEDSYHPIFVKEFELEKRPVSAKLYISGLGMYVAYMNDNRIGDEVLTPYYSDYNKEIQYQAFDVTDLLDGHNRIEVKLGDGWYRGAFGLQSKRGNWGSDFMAIAELHVYYPDGSEDLIKTDDSWEYYGSGITLSGIYDGESVDDTLYDDRENARKKAVITSAKGKLVDRYSIPVTEKEIMLVQDILNTPDGETVLDFGQNFAGYVSFYNRTPRGVRILFDTAEILQDGKFYNENYRSARSQFEYISDGREGWVTPDFTYFGFRYIRVRMWESKEAGANRIENLSLNKDDFAGKAIYSAMERTGFITTGNDKINRLYQNALWGQKSNSIDFPTDCPQRDERLGWCGDAQVFAGTASYNMNTAAFYDKFLHDVRIAQVELDGIVPGVLPVFDKRAAIYSSVWGDLGTILPSVLYEHYGDIKALELHYHIMKDWVDRITEDDKKRGQTYLYDWGAQLGDWLALDGRTEQSMAGGTDEYFIGACYYAMSALLTANAARALGEAAEEAYYMNLYEHIREAVLCEYFSESGRLTIDTQTGYIVSLYTGIYKDKKRIIEGLKKRLYKDCYKIKGGFVGAPIMCRVLADNGMTDEAFYYLMQEDYPGWIHCVNLGATTIWERWNSVLDDGHLSGVMMNSLNHYAFGSVVEFLYRNVGGLSTVDAGFRNVRIAPKPDRRLGFFDMKYKSHYGEYRVFWKIKENGDLHVEINIPFDATARIELPYSDGQMDGNYGAGEYEFDYTPCKDLTSRYSMKTLFKDMMEDDEAMEIIKKDSPLLLHFLGQEDYRYESLSTLSNMFFMGFTEEMIGKLSADLLALKMC